MRGHLTNFIFLIQLVLVVGLSLFVLFPRKSEAQLLKEKYSKSKTEQEFEKRKEKFLKNFSQKDFIDYLESLAEGEKPGPKDLDVIKKHRQKTQRLRSYYDYFDTRHEVPADFDRFVVLLGKLKDAISAGASPKPYARDLLAYLKGRDLDEMLRDFRPSSYKEMAAFTSERLAKLEEWASADILSKKKYHKLRKGLRSLYFMLKTLGFNEGQTKDLVKRIKDLEKSMGAVHDDLEEKDIRGEEIIKKLNVPKKALPVVQSAKVLLAKQPASCRAVLSKQ